ncbi:hypothetical protein, conserved in T. vivax [Trypanosoma vivax Y486]|uniref:Trypanosome variant surface glycoprotein B-type N-terminal domain-containing protein n=1 Tax=Trypanosoma vivax (strain Y486) TaxID=1055687 RepID=F9WT34_TRYVY|nr:hypothetical protein, conserved in T. vivax [Trypanosoma vivax Y486]|eukprot:CCD20723.1 hypothetical protein, conserved in T. vivax [Trypanosoma vivax Y486]
MARATSGDLKEGGRATRRDAGHTLRSSQQHEYGGRGRAAGQIFRFFAQSADSKMVGATRGHHAAAVAVSFLLATILRGGRAGDPSKGETAEDFAAACRLYMDANGATGTAKRMAAQVKEASGRVEELAQEIRQLVSGMEGTDKAVAAALAAPTLAHDQVESTGERRSTMNETAEDLVGKIGVAAQKAMTSGIDLTAETKDAEVKARLGSNQANTDAFRPNGTTSEGEDLAHMLIMLCNHGTTANACGGTAGAQCPCVNRVHKDQNRLVAVRPNKWTSIKGSGGIDVAGGGTAYGKNWAIALELCRGQNQQKRDNNDTVTPTNIRRDIMDLEARLVVGKADSRQTQCIGQKDTTNGCDGNSGALACICYDAIATKNRQIDFIAQMTSVADTLEELRNLEQHATARARTAANALTSIKHIAQHANEQVEMAANTSNDVQDTSVQGSSAQKDTRTQSAHDNGREKCEHRGGTWHAQRKVCSTDPKQEPDETSGPAQRSYATNPRTSQHLRAAATLAMWTHS